MKKRYNMDKIQYYEKLIALAENIGKFTKDEDEERQHAKYLKMLRTLLREEEQNTLTLLGENADNFFEREEAIKELVAKIYNKITLGFGKESFEDLGETNQALFLFEIIKCAHSMKANMVVGIKYTELSILLDKEKEKSI
jgi:hypothetical protein